jgi:nitrate reductase gamma subunit
MMLSDVVFSYCPYLAIFAFVGAWMYRWGILRNLGAAPAREVSAESEGALAVGFVVLAGGHLVTAMAPNTMRVLLADPARVTLIESVGLIGAFLFAFGVGARLRRRVQALREGKPRQGSAVFVLALLLLICVSGIGLTVAYRWITVWYAYIFAPYLRSLVVTDPVTRSIVASPWPVQLHTLLFMLFAALWPMSGLRLEEIFPLRGLARRFVRLDPDDGASPSLEVRS